MTEHETAIVVLDVIEPYAKPDYCVHGRVTCITCNEWCWVGHATLPIIMEGKAAPMCQPCATKLVPPDAKPIDHVVDHRRADGPHE